MTDVNVIRNRRTDLEAKLAEKSDRLTARFSGVENALNIKPVAAITGVLSQRKVWMGLAVGAGALAGLYVIFRSRRSSTPYDQGLKELSERLSKTVSKRISKGDELQEAVRKAMEKNPPILAVSERTGIFREAVSQVTRAVSAVAAREASRQLVAFLDRRADHESKS